jgi:hypothetical protein
VTMKTKNLHLILFLECEELAAEQLREILNGRKFHNDGRLHKTYQVRCDKEFKIVIEFRKPISRLTQREDGSAFAVDRKKWLYAL